MPVEAAQFRRARDHPRWPSLVASTAASASSPLPAEQRQQRRKHIAQRLGLALCPQSHTDDHNTSSSPSGAGGSALGPNYSAREATLRNDYAQHYVDTHSLPSNAVRNPDASTRFDEYPKLKRLVELKDALVTRAAHPPTFLHADLRPSLLPFRDPRTVGKFHLGSLIPIKYDVVLIDPPLEAYAWEATPTAPTWTWGEIAALPIPNLAAKESFVFLWVGSGAGDGLERGREVLAKWGYRRCEDIVCIRTNAHGAEVEAGSSVLTRSVQHCLMGIRGTVRRSTDVRFVHCNIDTDVILSSERDMQCKPEELYQLIENFCLGTRRLELFGRNRNLRRGWLTVGLELGPDSPQWPTNGLVPLPTPGLGILQQDAHQDASLSSHLEQLTYAQAYDKARYDSGFGVDRPGCDLRDRINLVPFDDAVEALRPKSPPPRIRTPAHRGMPNGLSNNPALQNPPPHPTHPPPRTARGAGLSGLGAGGRRTVSVPSGSDTLSGPQASVLKAKSLKPS
ncbi:predicted N6-adenine methylase involved in transcription regulation [Moesziomyces antarcticus T-34]|uniref:Predicted N6-adenine methylase involved in transcription regulation n=1 Tax=Pseudozyma antarctica (strain T-34) TaxID=1151754 RepID=M9LU18_PSEA3|nr:predicted N6-adenine methylase involved in transcription regulation [Moesziomyces antarcticus T-34]